VGFLDSEPKRTVSGMVFCFTGTLGIGLLAAGCIENETRVPAKRNSLIYLNVYISFSGICIHFLKT
jgi:hypothetical protein